MPRHVCSSKNQILMYDIMYGCSVDVQECHNGANGGCEHVCINSQGSYRCECSMGYYLLSNGRNCSGETNESQSPIQWNPGAVRSVLYREVSLIQRLINTNMVYLGPNTVSFIWSVSLFQSAHIEGFHCNVQCIHHYAKCVNVSNGFQTSTNAVLGTEAVAMAVLILKAVSTVFVIVALF